MLQRLDHQVVESSRSHKLFLSVLENDPLLPDFSLYLENLLLSFAKDIYKSLFVNKSSTTSSLFRNAKVSKSGDCLFEENTVRIFPRLWLFGQSWRIRKQIQPVNLFTRFPVARISEEELESFRAMERISSEKRLEISKWIALACSSFQNGPTVGNTLIAKVYSSREDSI